MDLSAFVGRLLAEEDGDVLREMAAVVAATAALPRHDEQHPGDDDGGAAEDQSVSASSASRYPRMSAMIGFT